MDPLAGTPWSAPNTVAGFVRGEPNQTLLAYAAQARSGGGRVLLDIGCGAARNLLPIGLQGWAAIGEGHRQIQRLSRQLLQWGGRLQAAAKP